MNTFYVNMFHVEIEKITCVKWVASQEGHTFVTSAHRTPNTGLSLFTAKAMSSARMRSAFGDPPPVQCTIYVQYTMYTSVS